MNFESNLTCSQRSQENEITLIYQIAKLAIKEFVFANL